MLGLLSRGSAFALLAVVLVVALATPRGADAHDLCKDHSRECRWKDALEVLCSFDDTVRTLLDAGAPADDPELISARQLIQHWEADLEANRQRLAADAAAAQAVAQHEDEAMARARAAWDRWMADRDRNLRDLESAVADLERDRCLLYLTALKPITTVTDAVLGWQGDTRARLLQETQSIVGKLTPMACREQPRKTMKNAAGEHLAEKLAKLAGYLAAKGGRLTEVTAGKVKGTFTVVKLALNLAAAAVDWRDVERLHSRLGEQDGVEELFYQWAFERAGFRAQAARGRAARIQAEIDNVDVALQRKGCPR